MIIEAQPTLPRGGDENCVRFTLGVFYGGAELSDALIKALEKAVGVALTQHGALMPEGSEAYLTAVEVEVAEVETEKVLIGQAVEALTEAAQALDEDERRKVEQGDERPLYFSGYKPRELTRLAEKLEKLRG